MKKRLKSLTCMKMLSALLLAGSFLFTACTVEVGDIVKENGMRCQVAVVDANGKPSLLLATEVTTKISADSAYRWAATIGDGTWHVPTSEQISQLAQYRFALNDARRRGKLPLVMQPTLFYWTSTPAGPQHTFAWGPLGVKSYFTKDAEYIALAVKEIKG